MTKDTKSIFQNSSSINSLNFYQDIYNGEQNRNCVIREQYKKSISDWKLKRKIERLIKSLDK